MTISAAALRELHRIHKQLTDLQDRISRGPRQIKAAEAGVAQRETECSEAKEALTQAKMLSDEKQLQLKGREDRISDLKSKLNTATSNKEYQALKEQIAADEQANSVLSDEILEILERIDVLVVDANAVEEKSDASRSELDKIQARVARPLESILRGDNTELFALFAYDANRRDTDVVVDAYGIAVLLLIWFTCQCH